MGKGHKDGLDVCLAFRVILVPALTVPLSLATPLALCSGNFLIIASSTSCAIALTWGGIRFPWSSANILVPLILGLVGIIAFLVYEATLAKHPIVSRLPRIRPEVAVELYMTRCPTHSFRTEPLLAGEWYRYASLEAGETHAVQIYTDIHQPSHHACGHL